MRTHDLIEAARNFPSRVQQRGSEFAALLAGQAPTVLFISCSDARVMPSLITNARPGQLFELRVTGPVVPPYSPADRCGVRSTIEYAVSGLEVRDIVLCGHSHCGTVQALSQRSDGRYGPSIDRWLRQPHVRALRTTDRRSYLEDETQRHVVRQLDALLTYPEVAERVSGGRLTLHGWYHELGTGVIRGYDADRGVFGPL